VAHDRPLVVDAGRLDGEPGMRRVSPQRGSPRLGEVLDPRLAVATRRTWLGTGNTQVLSATILALPRRQLPEDVPTGVDFE
jgi:hypothetical protein